MTTQKLTVTGKAQITIDEQRLRVSLVFTKGEDGDPLWNVATLKEVLEQHGLEGKVPEQRLREALRRIAQSNDHIVTLTLLEGIPPEKPVPETVTWAKDLSIPPEMEKDIEKVLAKAPPPEIYRELQETVKEEKEVLKKAALPFLPPKKEKITVTHKKTRREKVYVDPTVRSSFYVEEGKKLGVVSPAVPGLPGQDIFGEEIPPTVLADPSFYPGEGIRKERNELVALTTGILRVGRNWADIIPFRPHRWEVELSPDKASCFLSLYPGTEDAQFPDVSLIIQKVVTLGYPEERLLSPEEIQELIRLAIVRRSPLERVPISKDRDASFSIHISEDKLLATLTIRKGAGRGKPLNLKEVGKAIKESGLKPLDYKKIGEDILAFYHSPELELKDYVLVKGTPPQKGADRTLEPSVHYLPDEEAKAIKEKTATVVEAYKGIPSIVEFSLQEVEKLAYVEKDQPIFLISPATPGQPGTDVFGNQIPGLPGDTPPLVIHENIEEKGNLLIATIQGIMEQGEKDGVLHLRVRPHRDARILVETSPDDMEAYLTLEEGVGTGRKLTFEDILKAIREEGVVKGVDEGLVKEALRRAQEEGEVRRALVARGKEPVAGGQRRIEFLVPLPSGKPFKEGPSGQVNFKEQDRYTVVDEGQPIARIFPPAQLPEEGWDLRGRVRKPLQTRPSEITTGEGVREEPQEDGTILLLSTQRGVLSYAGGRIDILSRQVIKGDVDLSTGNLRLTGDITVKGSVRSGFYVITTGSILVEEGVEAALLSAGKSVIIKQGIKGGGKAVVRAKEDISARFAEHTRLLAVGDIHLGTACYRSLVKCNGRLLVGPEKGVLLGGKVKSRLGVEVGTLGSEKGLRTEVSFGQDYLIEDQIEIEEQEITKLKQQIVQLDNEIQRLARNGNPGKRQELHARKFRLLKIMEKRSFRLFTLRERFEQHFESSIIVHGTIHPGVVIESHGRIHEIRSPQRAVRITFDPQSGRIEINPLASS
ncbi:flagellar assembly protein A [Spirochaeta thermophila]|uniref:Polymerase most proteins contain PALM domain HD hydrolase domain and Zn-ribbon domain n=1 Tax=Winmispira thermophila (strain ATCC 49972 / DSM 6192 / RI 19.B1) TaxID=665571 RepID=E0RTE6_WINT6|nr:flagellar assembly protein A [Spirochaeta thermophila]ADN01012.1 polymerase most proteins contain PALM domain HD hydrolase domain and Zn-ribbon domain [Spirochaeta thermophila DSM 6192]